MAILNFNILAKGATVNPFNQVMSLEQTADDIFLDGPQKPDVSSGQRYLLMDFDWILITSIRRSERDIPEELIGRVVIVSPDKVALEGSEINVDLTTSPVCRQLSAVAQFPYTGDGLYHFQFQLREKDGTDWTSTNDLPLYVAFRPRVAAPEAPAPNK